MSDYFSVKAISNTALGYIDFENGGSPKKFYDFMNDNLQDDDFSYRRTGSLVHLAVLEPEKFKVAEVERPSDTICAIVDELFRRIGEDEFALPGFISDYQGTLSELVNEFGYQTNWKPETRVNKVVELGSEYFEYLKMVKTSEEIVLTSKEFATVMACAASLKTDPHISRVMFPTDLNDHMEILREEEFYFDHNGMNCKAKLDMIVLNHKRKLFMIVDLKTTSKGIQDFNESFSKFQYYRQFGFYKLAVQSRYPDYQMSLAACVAVETTGYNRARMFLVPERVVNKGIEKVNELMSVAQECMSSGNWEYEPSYLESPYEISLV